MASGYNTAQLQTIGRSAAVSYGLNPDVFVSLIQQESSWNPKPSTGNGGGLGQLLPAAVADMGGDYNRVKSDPAYNLSISAGYLAKMVHDSGNVYDGLRAYRAGLGNLTNPQWTAQTNAYANEILTRAGVDATVAKTSTGGAQSPTRTGSDQPNNSDTTGASGGIVGVVTGGSWISKYGTYAALSLLSLVLLLMGIWFVAQNEIRTNSYRVTV